MYRFSVYENIFKPFFIEVLYKFIMLYINYHSLEIIDISAGPILTESYTSFGRYLYEHKQSASELQTIIDLDAGDDLPTRCVKRVLRDMTCFNPSDRPTMEDIEIEIQGNNHIQKLFYI